MSNSVITLYDIPGNATKDKAWSPNVWKTRYALNSKRIPYKVEWVEYPDIKSTCERLGVPPSEFQLKNGKNEPLYTVPFIYDPKTQTYVSESFHIAQYLESTYPDTPKLFPEGPLNGAAALNLFEDVWMEKFLTPIRPLMMLKVHNQLNPASQPFFRETREAYLGKKLEDLMPEDKERQKEMWAAVKAGLGKIDGYMNWNGTATTFWRGDVRSYADFVMAAWLVWVQRIWRKGSPEWTELAAWHGGRWNKLVSEFENWEYADELENHNPKASAMLQ
ncbi:uncharacterized protein STEHIDRAFT_161553 [Stereum hirsutum FP-91666 SS1]|uniref:uncharacterized protein n=1 Tax=Stereum hirsutum (strain FP-91666) TaxID=721885 RepID=UPI000444A084|nr:uncharacterized protein STEHIDRAFT_161553 [Stereum hirsutum FP-91666 SS1]EIM81362.1 hypothetical protein STEHIDRAFT_161553 [Stereum hirsutum FP-91666 SS1]